jgi:apolipoprotein N-acyltransferase
MICFEGLFWDSAFKQVENGAQMLAIMSIDDWYMGTAAPDQLKTGAIWRAIESDIPVARAASTGYTMMVDQRGRVIREAPVGVPYALRATLYLPDHPQRMPLRQVFPWAFGLSVPIAWLMLLRRRP